MNIRGEKGNRSGGLQCAGALALVLAIFAPAGPAGAASARARAKTPGIEAQSARVTTDSIAAGYQARPGQNALAGTPITRFDAGRFAFTAPGRAQAARPQVAERSFTFTPSGNAERDHGALAMAATTRTLGPAHQAARGPAAVSTLEAGVAPSGYDMDVVLGYRGFSLSGGFSRFEGGLAGGSAEAMSLGLGYGRHNWRAGVKAGVEKGSVLAIPHADLGDRLTVEAGGAVSLSPKLSVGGALRYRAAPGAVTPLDPNADERAVLVGGALAF
jgi:hypothetical protein